MRRHLSPSVQPIYSGAAFALPKKIATHFVCVASSPSAREFQAQLFRMGGFVPQSLADFVFRNEKRPAYRLPFERRSLRCQVGWFTRY